MTKRDLNLKMLNVPAYLIPGNVISVVHHWLNYHLDDAAEEILNVLFLGLRNDQKNVDT
ncbi:unnamed protein product [Schistosoma margrebowiei]|uniref:Uncharacterized protein n=1 Tax=Schistosoma margrebowiei TaxID=48269 RepID=A0A3P8DEF9_9TREM|nr:unnamed protein product [Schistosoma margrebowiei]